MIKRKNKHPLYGLGPVFFKGGGGEVKETEDQKELAAVAAERWTDYQQNFVPAENHYIEEMVDYDKESRREALAGVSGNAVESAHGGALDLALNQKLSSGVDPGSASFNDAIDQSTNRKALDIASNTVRTGQELQDQRVQGMKNVVAVGNGQEADALQGMHEIATQSQRTAIDDAQSDFVRRSGRDEAIGTVVGAGGRAALNLGEE